jgi:hypothetical protein
MYSSVFVGLMKRVAPVGGVFPFLTAGLKIGAAMMGSSVDARCQN